MAKKKVDSKKLSTKDLLRFIWEEYPNDFVGEFPEGAFIKDRLQPLLLPDGDGLLTFMMIEVEETTRGISDRDQKIVQAIRALKSARNDIDAVINSLEDLVP